MRENRQTLKQRIEMQQSSVTSDNDDKVNVLSQIFCVERGNIGMTILQFFYHWRFYLYRCFVELMNV